MFFAVGKSGTRSIHEALGKYDDGFELSPEQKKLFLTHTPPLYVKERVSKEVWDTYFKFAFVRNTWDWVISQMFSNGIVSDVDTLSEDNIRTTYSQIKKFTRGVNWCDHKSQHAFLCDRDGSLLVDFVGRFEKLQDDLNKACNIIGIPQEPLSVIGKSNHRHYKQYYTNNTVNIVGELWQRDIENLNFSFESE